MYMRVTHCSKYLHRFPLPHYHTFITVNSLSKVVPEKLISSKPDSVFHSFNFLLTVNFSLSSRTLSTNIPHSAYWTNNNGTACCWASSFTQMGLYVYLPTIPGKDMAKLQSVFLECFNFYRKFNLFFQLPHLPPAGIHQHQQGKHRTFKPNHNGSEFRTEISPANTWAAATCLLRPHRRTWCCWLGTTHQQPLRQREEYLLKFHIECAKAKVPTTSSVPTEFNNSSSTHKSEGLVVVADRILICKRAEDYDA